MAEALERNMSSDYFGHRLRVRLSQLGKTGSDLAQELEVANSTVSQWVRGVNLPSRKKAQAIAQALDCNEDWLILGTGTPPNEPEYSFPPRSFHKSDVAGRLKYLMDAHRLKSSDLARMAGVSRSTITQWTHGTTVPSGQNLIKTCEALKCEPNWLLEGENTNQIQEIPERINTIDSVNHYSSDQLLLPFYTDSELTILKKSGSINIVDLLSPKQNIRRLGFSKTTIRKRDVNSETSFCIKINIPSMEPLFPEDTTVGVDTSQVDIRDGKLYAFWHYDTLRLAYLFRLPSGQLRIKSENQKDYPDEIIDIDNLKDITIIGRVFWYSVLI